MKKHEFESEYVIFKIRDGILYVTYKCPVVTLKEAKKIVEDRLNFTEGQLYPLLIDDVGMKEFDKPARDYLASEEGIKGVKAAAIFTPNLLSRVLAKFFLKVNVKKPKFPVNIFNNKREALKWLGQFKDENYITKPKKSFLLKWFKF